MQYIYNIIIVSVVSLVLNIVTAICLALLILSSLIALFSYSYSVDYYFKTAFLIVCCVFQAIAPYVKFTSLHFKFMISPFWRAGFIFMLGMFQFPSSIFWQLGALVFQYVCAIAVMVLGIVHLVVDIVGHDKAIEEIDLNDEA
ncbi:Hypothetical_protein [Hexamita inflata]|uniref:Hypothetical_protein n=1 Tax=Hexamita inflata TaxID=28002 RepID=A0AA86NTP2_9EUKA|nr:Hypothetical protein HINF_LOCUS13498 [Hexamita inflata]